MEHHSEPVTVDAAAVLDQISSRMRQEELLPERSAVRMHSGGSHYGGTFQPPLVPGPADHLAQIVLRLRGLQSGLDSQVEAAIRNIGAPPPSGADLRGRLGAAAIRILRGLLWWQTRTLHAFGGALAVQHQAELEVLKNIVLVQSEMRQELDALRAEVDRIRTAV